MYRPILVALLVVIARDALAISDVSREFDDVLKSEKHTCEISNPKAGLQTISINIVPKCNKMTCNYLKFDLDYFGKLVKAEHLTNNKVCTCKLAPSFGMTFISFTATECTAKSCVRMYNVYEQMVKKAANGEDVSTAQTRRALRSAYEKVFNDEQNWESVCTDNDPSTAALQASAKQQANTTKENVVNKTEIRRALKLVNDTGTSDELKKDNDVKVEIILRQEMKLLIDPGTMDELEEDNDVKILEGVKAAVQKDKELSTEANFSKHEEMLDKIKDDVRAKVEAGTRDKKKDKDKMYEGLKKSVDFLEGGFYDTLKCNSKGNIDLLEVKGNVMKNFVFLDTIKLIDEVTAMNDVVDALLDDHRYQMVVIDLLEDMYESEGVELTVMKEICRKLKDYNPIGNKPLKDMYYSSLGY